MSKKKRPNWDMITYRENLGAEWEEYNFPEGWQYKLKIYFQPLHGRRGKNWSKLVTGRGDKVVGPIPLPFKHRRTRW